ncbi:MAG: protein-L-isoaspartate(D-aspartate) O-methyltransferase [Maricaulaceae bacterium]
MVEAGPDPRLAQLVLTLRRSGISDKAVLQALERTPRDFFISEAFQDHAYDDQALPIECGQTISQPSVVALMTEALAVDDRCKVLEIGTGSGYQTAVLARLGRRIYTVERYRSLMQSAEARFRALHISNVVTRFGDGSEGWPEQAPFDRIMATAAAERTPEALLAQLKPEGVLVAPVGPSEDQRLYRWRGPTSEPEELAQVRFVPLVAGRPTNQ